MHPLARIEAQDIQQLVYVCLCIGYVSRITLDSWHGKAAVKLPVLWLACIIREHALPLMRIVHCWASPRMDKCMLPVGISRINSQCQETFYRKQRWRLWCALDTVICWLANAVVLAVTMDTHSAQSALALRWRDACLQGWGPQQSAQIQLRSHVQAAATGKEIESCKPKACDLAENPCHQGWEESWH